jgi:hypothetical protein
MVFFGTLCNWIKKILYDGTMAVKINNVVGLYFKSSKGVREGDPLSPFLFNAAVQCLAKMVLKLKIMISLRVWHLISLKKVCIMQYADDTVICITHDPEKATKLKLLLHLLMSGLKFNYQKSEIYLIGGDNVIADAYSSLFGCQVGNLPMKYLGVPVTHRTLRLSDLDPLDAKFIKINKLDAWVGGSNSSGGRITLVNASLSGLPSYFMSLFFQKKTFLEKMDKHRRRFIWHGKKKHKGLLHGEMVQNLQI